MIAKAIFFTKGVGVHKEKLASFEQALRDAGVEKCNLVPVSSIKSPGSKIIPRERGLKLYRPGEVTFCVMSRNETNEPNRLISASIGCAVPADEAAYGYLSEHHAFGQTEKKADEYAEDLAASMLASTLGIEFDVNQAYDERKEMYKMSGKIVKTTGTTQSAIGNKDGLWTSVVALCMFIMEDPDELEAKLGISKRNAQSLPQKQNGHEVAVQEPGTTAVAAAESAKPAQ